MTPARAADVGLVLELKTLHTFRELVPEDLTGLAALGRVRELAPGESLGGEPDEGATIRFLVSGRLAVDSEPGARAVRPGDWIGGLAALAGQAGPVASARVPARCFEIDRAAFLDLLEAEFELLLAVLAGVARTAGRRLRAVAPARSAPPDAGSRVDLAEWGLVRKLDALRALRVLRAESVHTLGRVALAATPVELETGESPWSADDPADALWVTVSGVLEVRDPKRAGSSHVGPGRLLGALECLAGDLYAFAPCASTPVQALRIERDALLDILEDAPEVAVEGMIRLCRQIARLTEPASQEPS